MPRVHKPSTVNRQPTDRVLAVSGLTTGVVVSLVRFAQPILAEQQAAKRLL
jgi:hypothetical protein